MADWNSPRLLLWFLFQHPRLFATAICIQVLGWSRFVHLELLPCGPIQTQSPSRHPCKSFVKGEKDSPDARLGGARTIEAIRTRSSHVCLSAVVPAFAEPDIHSLSQAASAHQNPA